ncbi:MAG: MotA/TolQ/ExbB proton channel family protein [Gammaproteobacteria bacterium]|nr:MAG: MotA/TolQ/ExbB proton channel family protein [Gammaproteobacteria bacterium]
MSQMFKSLIVLVVTIISVHLVYIGVIRPQAALSIENALSLGQSMPRNLFVILKDFEQEVCLVLMFWGSYLILSKCVALLKDRYLFNVDLLEKNDEGSLSLDEALKGLEKLPADALETPLVQTLMASVRRFLITNDVQNTSDAIQSSVEALAVKLEADNSMIRYLIWAIPSIGFIGTVRGIGQALSQADQALAGNIAGMTNSLGMAFNSTLIALLISIFLMFFLHQLQSLQDALVVDTQAYCEKFLLNRISR